MWDTKIGFKLYRYNAIVGYRVHLCAQPGPGVLVLGGHSTLHNAIADIVPTYVYSQEF